MFTCNKLISEKSEQVSFEETIVDPQEYHIKIECCVPLMCAYCVRGVL